MPFFRCGNKIVFFGKNRKKRHSVTLQVRNPLWKWKKTAGRRVSFSVSLQMGRNMAKVKGSMTVEAALGFTLFLFFMALMAAPLSVMDTRMQVQAGLEAEGERIAQYAYAAADFAEIGEPLEDTVRREVMEEVGLPVKNIRFYKSQPWSFSSSLLAGFYCDLDTDDETVTLQADELGEGTWFDRENLPVGGSDISLTREMIQRFRQGPV